MSVTGSRPRVSRWAQAALARGAYHYPSRVRALAEPPPGGGLAPVMGRFGPPWIGHSLNAVTDPLELSRRNRDRFGPVSWTGLMGRPLVLALGPEAAEQVLLDREGAFSAERGWDFLVGPFLRGGIMLMDAEEHRYHRRILQQAFTRARLVDYAALMRPDIATGVDRWRPSRRFPFYSSAKQLLLELASKVFVGAGEARHLERAFVDLVRGGQAMVRASVPGGVWARGLRGRRLLAEHFRREIPAKRSGDGADLFGVLCRAASEEGDSLTDEQVTDHMIFMLMAAHDTSTIALSMMGYLLGRHPEWQDRVRAESLALGAEVPDYDELGRLPALDLVFRETLRMYAPAGLQMREAVKDTEILGHFVPAGCAVGLYPYATLRMEPWWREPDRFDPERFAEGRGEDRAHRFTWAPFGGGAHTCIGQHFAGMTVKAIMHRMLVRYRWSVPAGYRVPLVWGTGPTPADGLPIDLRHGE